MWTRASIFVVDDGLNIFSCEDYWKSPLISIWQRGVRRDLQNFSEGCLNRVYCFYDPEIAGSD